MDNNSSFAPGGSPSTWDGIERRRALRHQLTRGEIIWRRLVWIVLRSDTTSLRFLLAIASLLWSIFLFMPGDTFERPVYRIMARVGSEELWATFWLLHAVGVLWRVFATRKRVFVAYLLNSLGLVMYAGVAVAIYATRTEPFPAAIAPDLTLALIALWVMARTAINSEHGWRAD
jgi:hypothetical protein